MNLFPFLRRAVSTATQNLKVRVGSTLYPPGSDNVVTLPFERVVLPAAADPTTFQRLLDQMNQAAVQVSTQVQATLSQLRQLTQASTGLSYYVAQPAPGRVFRYDPTDTTSLDDGVLTVVDAGGNRYKVDLGGDVYISWLNVFPYSGTIDQAQDASAAFLSLAQLLNGKGLQGKWICFPAGRYRWDTAVVTNTDKDHFFTGQWRCPDGEAYMVTRGTGSIWFSSPWNVRNVIFDAAGGTPVTGKDANGYFPTDYRHQGYKDNCPIQVSAVCDLKNTYGINAAGHGIRFNGNVAYRNAMFPSGSNSSCAHMRDGYQPQGNAGAGIYVEGPDEGSVDNNEIYFRDAGAAGCSNNGWGYVDRSFLGCRTNNRQANNNTYGHNFVDNVNAIASLYGIYEEDTNQNYPSSFTGQVVVEGRLTGSPSFTQGATWLRGRNFSHVTTANLNLVGGGTAMRISGPGVAFETRLLGGNSTVVTQQEATSTDLIVVLAQQGARVQKPGSAASRVFERNSYWFEHLYYGPNLNDTEYATGVDDPTIQNKLWRVGDTLRLTGANIYLPEYYKCLRAGVLATGNAQYNGVTVSGNSSALLYTSAVPSMFTVGDYVQVGTSYAQVLAIDSANKVLTTDGYFESFSNRAIYHAPPLFQARGGHLSGLDAQKPAAPLLGTVDAGLLYYATDSTKTYRWSGAAWNQIT